MEYIHMKNVTFLYIQTALTCIHDRLVHVFSSISVDSRQVGRLKKEAEHQVYTFVPVQSFTYRTCTLHGTKK